MYAYLRRDIGFQTYEARTELTFFLGSISIVVGVKPFGGVVYAFCREKSFGGAIVAFLVFCSILT